MLIPIRKLRYIAAILTFIGIGYSFILISALFNSNDSSGYSKFTINELDPFQNPQKHNLQNQLDESALVDQINQRKIRQGQALRNRAVGEKIQNHNNEAQIETNHQNLKIEQNEFSETHILNQNNVDSEGKQKGGYKDTKPKIDVDKLDAVENRPDPKNGRYNEIEQRNKNAVSDSLQEKAETKGVEVDAGGRLVDSEKDADNNPQIEKPDNANDIDNNKVVNVGNEVGGEQEQKFPKFVNSVNELARPQVNNNYDERVRIDHKDAIAFHANNSRDIDPENKPTHAEEKIPGKPADLNNPWFEYVDLKDKYDKSNDVVELPPDGQFDKVDHDDKSGEYDNVINGEENGDAQQGDAKRDNRMQTDRARLAEKPNIAEAQQSNNRDANDVEQTVAHVNDHDNSPMVNEDADDEKKSDVRNDVKEKPYLFKKWRNFGIDDVAPDLTHIFKVEPGQPWENIVCDEFLYDRTSNYRNYLIYKRLSLQPNNDEWITQQATNCDNFKKQYHFPEKPYTEEEAAFPLAYAMLFHHQIEQVVNLLRAVYWPQNYYCIHIDESATESFKEAVNQVASCFPNIFLIDSLKIEWGSFEILEASVNCLDALRRYPDWKYVQMLSNSDFPLRTNREMVQIFKILNGSNDCSLQDPEVKRFAVHQDNKSKVRTIPPSGITLYQGGFQASLTHEFVDFLRTDPRILEYYDWLRGTRIADEFFWGSVMFNLHLNAPGNFPGTCLAYYDLMRVYKPFISRYQIWRYFPIDQSMFKQCRSRRFTNWSCVYGIKDMPVLIEKPHLFLHKMYYNYQPIALYCLTEWFHNQTYGLNNYGYKLDLNYYHKLPHVLYHHSPNKTEFKCGLDQM